MALSIAPLRKAQPTLILPADRRRLFLPGHPRRSSSSRRAAPGRSAAPPVMPSSQHRGEQQARNALVATGCLSRSKATFLLCLLRPRPMPLSRHIQCAPICSDQCGSRPDTNRRAAHSTTSFKRFLRHDDRALSISLSACSAARMSNDLKTAALDRKRSPASSVERCESS